jgi:HD-GYP domain-containing protein (c-di-GMP phosphodiesterase class II)
LRIIRWIVKAIFSDFGDYFTYVLMIFSLVFFDVALYYSMGELFSKYLILTLVWFFVVLFTALVIFRLVVKAAQDTFKETMSILEVAAFLELKRKAEEKKKEEAPKIVVAEEQEQRRSILSRIVSKVAPKREQEFQQAAAPQPQPPKEEPKQEKKSRPKKQADSAPEKKEQEQVQQPEPQPEQVEEKAEERPEEQVEERKVEIKVAEEEQTPAGRSSLEELLEIFSRSTSDEKLLELAGNLFSLYLEEPKLNSLGFTPPENLAKRWQALGELPLHQHVLNVVKEADALAQKNGLEGLERTALLLSALAHDLGKLKAVQKFVGARRPKVQEHPQYGYAFLIDYFREKEEKGELPFSREWFEQVASAVKLHHTVVPEDKPKWFKLLKEADWEARRKESGLTEQELREFYKEVVLDYSVAGEEESREFVLQAFRKAVVEKIAKQPHFAYPVAAGVPTAFFAVDQEERAYIYIDPEVLLKALVLASGELRRFAEGFRTKRGKDGNYYYNNELKRFVVQVLEEAGFAQLHGRYSNVLVFEGNPKKISGLFDKNGKKAIMAVPLVVSTIAKEAGLSEQQVREAVNTAVRRKPSLYYVGKAKDENADKLLFIPSKEVVEELSS